MHKNNQHKSVISIDVEDAISLAMNNFFDKKVSPTDRVVVNTEKMLLLLQQNKIKATFFVLGSIAKAFPELIRNIDQEGHEIGIHGNNHVEFYRMTPEQAYREVMQGKEIVESVIGKEVFGHRAPAFSINAETAWVFDILARAGFEYDSSVVPAAASRYGWPGFCKDIQRMELADNRKLVEVPLSTYSIMGKEFLVCGGGYFRIFPYAFTKYAFKRIIRKRPVILYFHPHEIDIGPFPRFYIETIKRATLIKKLKIKSYWLNRSRTENKMALIFSQSTYTTMRSLVKTYLELPSPQHGK